MRRVLGQRVDVEIVEGRDGEQLAFRPDEADLYRAVRQVVDSLGDWGRAEIILVGALERLGRLTRERLATLVDRAGA